MQACVYNFNNGRLFLGMRANRNTSAVVLNAKAAIGMFDDFNTLCVARQGFIGRIIDDLLNDVQRIFGTRVHARPLTNRLKTF